MSGKIGGNRAKLEESLNRIKPLPVKAFPLFSAGCKDGQKLSAIQALFRAELRPHPREAIVPSVFADNKLLFRQVEM